MMAPICILGPYSTLSLHKYNANITGKTHGISENISSFMVYLYGGQKITRGFATRDF